MINMKDKPTKEMFDGLSPFLKKIMSQTQFNRDKFAEYIDEMYRDVIEFGEFLSNSDGQFTGGYYSEEYKYKDQIHTFIRNHEGNIESLISEPIEE